MRTCQAPKSVCNLVKQCYCEKLKIGVSINGKILFCLLKMVVFCRSLPSSLNNAYTPHGLCMCYTYQIHQPISKSVIYKTPIISIFILFKSAVWAIHGSGKKVNKISSGWAKTDVTGFGSC